MKDVIEENRELEKMVSAGRVDQLSVDISLLKRENELCRERIEGESPPTSFDVSYDGRRC